MEVKAGFGAADKTVTFDADSAKARARKDSWVQATQKCALVIFCEGAGA